MATLNLQVIFDAKDKITGPMRAIIGGSNELSKAFKQTNSELKGLKDQQNAVNRFRELNTQIGKSTQDINKYKQSIKELKDQGKLGPLTQEQTKALSGAEAGLKRVKRELKDQQSRLTETTQGIQKFGFSINQLDDQESQLKNKIHLTTMELNKRKSALDNAAGAQERFAKTQSILQKGSDIAKKGMMVAGVGAATLTVPAKLSIDFESSMADIAKVVDGLKDDAGKVTPAYVAMSKEIIAMSSRLPMAATDIASIVAAGGQSGIAADQLTQFAESAVKMGVAFDISASEAGQSMAELRTAFRLNQGQVVELADKINYLGNNTPAAAKGIMEIVQRIGPLGEVGGFASGSIAALGATLRGMGVQEEIAATGIKNMMLALVAGESATKGQKEAWSELGMDYEKVAKDMQTNAEGTTLAVLQSISKLDKYKQASVLGSLFGKESLSAIAPLLTNMDALQTNLGMVADKTKYAGSMEKEYAARAATTANNLQLLKNKLSGVAITIGNNLLPMINSGVTAFSNVIARVQAWADANPALAATLTKVAVGGVLLLGAVSAVALGVLTFLGPLAMLKMALSTLSGGAGIAAGALKMLLGPIKMIGLAFSIVGKAILTNPMVLAITAIVAVVAGAAYLIYKNWTPIKAFFSDIWSNIKTAFNSGVNSVKDIWQSMVNGVNQLWNNVKSAFNTGINFIKSVIQGIDNLFSNNPILNILMPFIGIPRMIIANWSSITSVFSQVWGAVSSTIGGGINRIVGIVSQGFSSVYQTVSSIWSSITQYISTIWNNITSSVNGAINTVSGLVSTGFNMISGIISRILSTIKNIVSVAWTGLCNIFLTITPLGFIIRNFDQIIAFLTGMGSRFLSIGRNIVDGLINGILSGFDRLKGVWEKINSYMPDFMRKKMDIHSPSRVMAGMGGYIVDGIGVGLNNKTPALQSQFNKTLGVFDSSPGMPSTPKIKRRFVDEIGLTEKPVGSVGQNGSQQPPKFQRAVAIQNPRSISITNSDNITIHINGSGKGPLSNAAAEVRQALQERDRQRNADLRRQLKDSE